MIVQLDDFAVWRMSIKTPSFWSRNAKEMVALLGARSLVTDISVTARVTVREIPSIADPSGS
jgi:hypothetical protein